MALLPCLSCSARIAFGSDHDHCVLQLSGAVRKSMLWLLACLLLSFSGNAERPAAEPSDGRRLAAAVHERGAFSLTTRDTDKARPGCKRFPSKGFLRRFLSVVSVASLP